MSVHLSVRLSVVLFLIFVFVVIYSVGVQSYNAFSPHWGLEDPIGVHSSLHVRISVSIYLCPVDHIAFCKSKCAAHNFVQGMRPQATGLAHL